jgi:enamine deaminase RidA (YjgF/YER057c/UK114 family)
MPKAISPKQFGPPLGMYSHGMVAPGGEIVVVAGQVGMGPGGRVAGDDVMAQTKQALENVRMVLEAAGCTMRDVVRFQTFLTHAEDLPGFMKARAEVFPSYFSDGVYPPNTLLVISGLVRPELRVEIEALAVRPARAGAAARRVGKSGRATATSPRRRARR